MQPKHLFCITILLITPKVYSQPATTISYKNYAIDRSVKEDSNLIKLLQPYNDSLSRYMNEVIGFCNKALYKKQPESALGNLMADAMKAYAAKAFKTNVDAAFINYGSIRSYLPKGEIKRQTVYDLMPYDNLIVLQKVNGNNLYQLLDLFAFKGGCACSGITMNIKNKKATDVYVNNAPLNDTLAYTIAILDYLANGGDGCTMLKNGAKENKNILYRTALIDYIQMFTNDGKPVTANTETRIVNAD